MKKKEIINDNWVDKVVCTVCKLLKPLSDFNKRAKNALWIEYRCKECRKKEYNNNRDDILNNSKEYYLNNKDKKLLYQNNYYHNNSDKIKKQHKEYRENNYDKIKERRRELYKENKEHYDEKMNAYIKSKEKEIWFDWWKFHDKARYIASYYWLTPNKCSICWAEWKVLMHHPSYNDFNERKNVVFVCNKCHINIHLWLIDCPEPVNLEELKDKAVLNKKNNNGI